MGISEVAGGGFRGGGLKNFSKKNFLNLPRENHLTEKTGKALLTPAPPQKNTFTILISAHGFIRGENNKDPKTAARF